MPKLVAFGDSFTWGTDLKDAVCNALSTDLKQQETYENHHYQDRKIAMYSTVDHKHRVVSWEACYSRNTWPALLANNLGLEYVCYAVQGCSNQTIIRQFFEYLPYINDNDVVIVNWTWIDRWDFCVPKEEKIISQQWQTVRPSGPEDSKFKEIYFKHMQSELWDKVESLKVILLIINTLKSKNIPFIMTCIDKLIIDQTYHSPNYITNLQNEVANYIAWFQDKGFYHWAKDNDYPIHKEGGHPLEEAHQAAFEYIRDNHDFTK